MNTSPKQRLRPLAVNLAVVLVLVTAGASLARTALRADWNFPLVYAKFVFELLMLALPLWFTWRGKNWARWLLVAFALGGLCLSVPGLIEHIHTHAASWIVTYSWQNLIDVIALVLLFHPSASQWFRGCQNAISA